MPTRARAASIASRVGSRPSRLRNPQQRLSGVLVMSKAPAVRPCRSRQTVQVAAEGEQREEVRVDGGRPLRGRAVDAAQLARFAEDAERRFQPIRLVQRFAGRRDVRLVRAVEEDLEPARHGGTMDANPVALFLRAPE